MMMMIIIIFFLLPLLFFTTIFKFINLRKEKKAKLPKIVPCVRVVCFQFFFLLFLFFLRKKMNETLLLQQQQQQITIGKFWLDHHYYHHKEKKIEIRLTLMKVRMNEWMNEKSWWYVCLAFVCVYGMCFTCCCC